MRWPRALRAPLVYTAAALLYTWPLVLHPVRLLGAGQGPGDPFLNLWIIGWDLRTLATHPAAFFSGEVFNANIFHPAANTLAYSDHFLLQALGVSPIYFLTHNPVLCYNVVLVVSLIGAAWAMHIAVREIVDSEIAAWTAGIAWGFAPYHFGHLIHIQLQALYVLPLAFLFLHRTLTTGRVRDACLLGVMLGGLAITSVYYAVIGGIGLSVVALVLFVRNERHLWLRTLLHLGLALLIGTILMAPIGYRYLSLQQHEGFGRSLAEAGQGSAGLRAYLTAPPDNLLYGRTEILRPGANAVAPKATEQMLFPGFALMALAVVGVWRGLWRGLWRSRQHPSTRALALALVFVGIVGFLLSLGPDGIRPLYAAAHRAVFGFQAIRAPARFGVLVLFALAGLAGIGVRELARTRPRLAAVLIALVAIEYVNAPMTYARAPELVTDVDAWLRDAPEHGAVMYQPLAIDATVTTPFMVRSLVHGRRMLNGYSGLRPAFYDSLAQSMAAFPSMETIRSLDDLGVRFVVTGAPLDAGGLPLLERARFDDGVVYEVTWTPEASAAIEEGGSRSRAVAELTSLPFAAGETATYSIVWTTGPLDIAAGRATFRVGEGRNGARFELSAEGVTAPWVSKFFEADDRFVSLVDASLRPSSVEQRLHEGSRRAEKRASFDRASGTVRLQQGQGVEVSLPASPGAFDPVSAIYYLRAAVHLGSVLKLPVNDWGREVFITVPPGVIETVTLGGTAVETLRLEPHVSKRDGQPAAYRLTLWLSQDARRIPVLMTVDGLAGVGSVRFELASFSGGRP